MSGSDTLSHFYCFFQRIVRYVLSVFDTVDDEMLKTFQLGEFLFGNMVHISAVGYVPEAVSQYGKLVMHSADRDDTGGPDRVVLSCHRMDVALARLPRQDFVRASALYGKRILIYIMNVPFRCSWIFLFRECI